MFSIYFGVLCSFFFPFSDFKLILGEAMFYALIDGFWFSKGIFGIRLYFEEIWNCLIACLIYYCSTIRISHKETNYFSEYHRGGKCLVTEKVQRKLILWLIRKCSKFPSIWNNLLATSKCWEKTSTNRRALLNKIVRLATFQSNTRKVNILYNAHNLHVLQVFWRNSFENYSQF